MGLRARWTDLHNHLIPAVDDGARDEAESGAAIRELTSAGVTSIVTTPHLDGSITLQPGALRERLEELDHGWVRLVEVAEQAGLADLGRGVEVKLDVPQPDLSDSRVRLGGSRAVLVEFPHMMVPPRSEAVLSALRREGYVPLLAHPERYQGLSPDLDLAAHWVDSGAYLQMNAPSLTGRYGSRAEELAWALLERGLVHCMSSDYHSRGESRLRSARSLLEKRGGEEQARLLFEENPTRLLADEEPLPLPPLERQGALRRLFGRLGVG